MLDRSVPFITIHTRMRTTVFYNCVLQINDSLTQIHVLHSVRCIIYIIHIPPQKSRMVELYVGYTRDDTSRSISMLPCPPLNFKANEEAYTGFSPRKGIKQNRGVQQFMYAIFIIKNPCAGSRRSLAVIYKDRRTLLSNTVNYQITIYNAHNSDACIGYTSWLRNGGCRYKYGVLFSCPTQARHVSVFRWTNI